MKLDDKELQNQKVDLNLKKALAILKQYDQKMTKDDPTIKSLAGEQEHSNGKTTKKVDDATATMPISYEQVVLDALKIRDQEITQLQNDKLSGIAKIQTMARRHGDEQNNIRKYGVSKLAQDILKPIDLFKKILTAPVKNEEIKNYLMGFDMIAKQLDQALNNNGIEKIDLKIGDEFDSKFHEATEVVETNEFAPNQIVEIIADGYKIHDRVLIHSLVKVAVKQTDNKENDSVVKEEAK